MSVVLILTCDAPDCAAVGAVRTMEDLYEPLAFSIPDDWWWDSGKFRVYCPTCTTREIET